MRLPTTLLPNACHLTQQQASGCGKETVCNWGPLLVAACRQVQTCKATLHSTHHCPVPSTVLTGQRGIAFRMRHIPCPVTPIPLRLGARTT